MEEAEDGGEVKAWTIIFKAVCGAALGLALAIGLWRLRAAILAWRDSVDGVAEVDQEVSTSRVSNPR